MTTFALRFPGGRYHATPWGRHVNEGEVEWPPSPWRMIRALLASGFTRLGWLTIPEEAGRLIEALAAAPPSYRLPEGTIAHTRHYMPIISGRKQTTTKVIDAFVRLDRDADLLVHYPVELPEPETRLLEALVGGLGYLGRAESWVDGRSVADCAPDAAWCTPFSGDGEPLSDGDNIPLIAPITAARYSAWRDKAMTDAIARAEAAAQARGKKLTKSQRLKAAAPFPADLVACLLIDTDSLQRDGWSEPPGSRTILYHRPSDALRRRVPRLPPRRARNDVVQAALLSLSSDTKTGDVLPLFTRCLPQAELLHQAVVSKLGDAAPQSPVLSGRDPVTRRPLEGHCHAHYLPLDLDRDGRLDHVIIHAPMGLDEAALSAIRRVTRTWTKGGDDRPIVVTCAGFGSLEDIAAQLRRRDGTPLAALDMARSWVSITPFVPPRHLKRRRHTLEDQVRAELESRGFPDPTNVIALDRDEVVRRRLLRFVRSRRAGKPQPPAPRAFGIRLTFDGPVHGPIALGYASHFGLGLFAAEE